MAYNVKLLDALVALDEPIVIEFRNPEYKAGTHTGILTGVYNDGRFDVYRPDTEEELTFHLEDTTIRVVV